MGRPWTRDDWNDIIQRVNAISDSGCSSGTPLPEVAENHIWTIDDIELVRGRLTQMCSNSPSFTTDLEKWKQEIIDEIEEAIENCQCCDPMDDNGITYGPFSLESQAYGADHWTMYYFNPSGYQFGSNNILGRWASVTLYGAQITGLTSLKTTPYTGPLLDCMGYMQMQTWYSAQGSSDTSIAPAMAAGGLLPIIDVKDWLKNYVWYQPPWTASMYITITVKCTGNYSGWLRCTNNCSGGDYHTSIGGTLNGACPLASKWWSSLEGIQAAIEVYNRNRTTKLQIASVLPWTAYYTSTPYLSVVANGATFVSLAYV
jgi:hypothetical protein